MLLILIAFKETPEYFEPATTGFDTNCPDNDLKSIGRSFLQCCHVCLYNAECVGVVYSINEDVGANCILKHTSICDSTEYQAGTVAYRKRELKHISFLGMPHHYLCLA